MTHEHQQTPANHEQELIERVRRALLDAARQAWEDAGISGLCGEGAWELAYDAMQNADLTHLHLNANS